MEVSRWLMRLRSPGKKTMFVLTNLLDWQGICRNQVKLSGHWGWKFRAVVNTSAGHGEAAVKLQRDWITDPQTLPFAQYIKTHALVVLVQKGLQYYEIEQSINQVRGAMLVLHTRILSGPTRMSPDHRHHHYHHYFLALSPVERLRLSRKMSARKMAHVPYDFLHERASTVVRAQQMGYHWSSLLQNERQSGVDAVMEPKAVSAATK